MMQAIQDKYGYVVIGCAVRGHQIGDVLPGLYEIRGQDSWIETPLKVIGFGSVDEWAEQVESTGYPFSRAQASKAAEILKVVAE